MLETFHKVHCAPWASAAADHSASNREPAPACFGSRMYRQGEYRLRHSAMSTNCRTAHGHRNRVSVVCLDKSGRHLRRSSRRRRLLQLRTCKAIAASGCGIIISSNKLCTSFHHASQVPLQRTEPDSRRATQQAEHTHPAWQPPCPPASRPASECRSAGSEHRCAVGGWASSTLHVA